MSKKIFAIGGGKDYRIYREMIRFADLEKPEVLVIPHAQPLEKQQGNYHRMYNILAKDFGCGIKILKSNELADNNKVKEMLKSSDIIYVCQGNTTEMLNIWKEYNFDYMLKEQYDEGKLLSGTSAGAVCWFNSFTTENNGCQKVGYGLNLVDCYITCHGQERRLADFHKGQLKNNSKLGILLTNGSAIEIVDNQCRIITKDSFSLYPDYDVDSYSDVSYYQDGVYNETRVIMNNELEELNKSLVLKLKK